MSKTNRRLFRPIIKVLDFLIPKNPNLWIFPVCHKRKVLYDNPRFLLEVAKNNPEIELKVLTYDLKPENHQGYEKYLVSIFSFQAILFLLKAGVIVIRHGLYDFYWMGISNRNRQIINVWHGIPLKGIRYFTDTFTPKRLRKEADSTSAIIASSVIDKLAMSSAHQIPPNKVWVTGLPRNDVFSSDFFPTPMIKREEEKLQALTNGKKLILYAPTFRDNGSGSYPFSLKDLEAIKTFCEKYNYVFATRLHVRDSGKVKSDHILDLGQNVISETAVLLKHTAILITDYSSIWVDYLLMDRPIIGLCHDFENYMNEERGFIYPYNKVFPGKICSNFSELSSTLTTIVEGNEASADKEKRQQAIEMFHQHSNDGLSSQRVFNEIRRAQKKLATVQAIEGSKVQVEDKKQQVG